MAICCRVRCDCQGSVGCWLALGLLSLQLSFYKLSQTNAIIIVIEPNKRGHIWLTFARLQCDSNHHLIQLKNLCEEACTLWIHNAQIALHIWAPLFGLAAHLSTCLVACLVLVSSHLCFKLIILIVKRVITAKSKLKIFIQVDREKFLSTLFVHSLLTKTICLFSSC